MSDSATDNQHPILNSVRVQIGHILKEVDDFVQASESAILKREEELDKKIKKYSTLETREKKLADERVKLLEDQSILRKEQNANRDFARSLELQKNDLTKKLSQVQSIIGK